MGQITHPNLGSPMAMVTPWAELITVGSRSLDPSTYANVSIEYEHHKVHEGDAYRRCHAFENIANNTSGNVFFKVGSIPIHIKIQIAGAGTARGDFYEGTTVSDSGTAIVINNFNRLSSNTSNSQIYHTPIITGIGSLLCAQYAFGGVGGNSIGGNVRDNFEWILNPGSNYNVAVTNLGGTSKDVFVALEWYEHTPKS